VGKLQLCGGGGGGADFVGIYGGPSDNKSIEKLKKSKKNIHKISTQNQQLRLLQALYKMRVYYFVYCAVLKLHNCVPVVILKQLSYIICFDTKHLCVSEPAHNSLSIFTFTSRMHVKRMRYAE
jgi:hypothetical protein